MQSRLFRKTSLERISSPEQLQDYMRVTSPGIWLVLGAVIVLLAGLILSSAIATLESTIPLQGEVLDDGRSIAMEMALSEKDVVQTGMTVRVAGREGTVSFLYEDEAQIMAIADLKESEESLPEGVYDVEIVTEELTPISFLIN